MDDVLRSRTNGGRWQDRGRPEEILAAATRLFFERGYHTTKLDDIANLIGFTKPAIYHYFSSKDEILYTIRSTIVCRALEELKALLDGPGTPAEKLRAGLEAHVRTVIQNIEAWAVFHHERGLLSPERERQVREIEREYEKLFRGLYEEGAESGELTPLDPRLATNLLLSACNGVYLYYRGEPMEAFSRNVVALLATGFLQPVRAV